MKKIIVVSDTHLSEWCLPEKLLDLMENADLIVHAGDFDSYKVYKKFRSYELKAVSGNMDDDKIKEELPKVETFKIEGVKFGLVHKGNYLNDFSDLGYKALELDVNFLIFGHIHRFVVEDFKKAVLLCPGSPTKPRLSAASCAEITVDGSKVNVRCHIVQNLFCGMNALEGFR
ncbi:MAG: metallophosphoesterase [Archaeoglobaceae archaeon]|nr:metallophosphoesterase [Archaeoglobaceae archaeon]HDD36704.1 metallophosphoesterase [Archaeoglobus veneficus]